MGYCCFTLFTNSIKITDFGWKYGKGFQTSGLPPKTYLCWTTRTHTNRVTGHQPMRHEITVSCYLETFHVEFHISA